MGLRAALLLALPILVLSQNTCAPGLYNGVFLKKNTSCVQCRSGEYRPKEHSYTTCLPQAECTQPGQYFTTAAAAAAGTLPATQHTPVAARMAGQRGGESAAYSRAENCIDGQIDSSDTLKQCASENPWLELDLGSSKTVTHVIITNLGQQVDKNNKTYFCGARLAGTDKCTLAARYAVSDLHPAEVYVDDCTCADGNAQCPNCPRVPAKKCTAFTGVGLEFVVVCDGGHLGRYVRLFTKVSFSLVEFRAYNGNPVMSSALGTCRQCPTGFYQDAAPPHREMTCLPQTTCGVGHFLTTNAPTTTAAGTLLASAGSCQACPNIDDNAGLVKHHETSCTPPLCKSSSITINGVTKSICLDNVGMCEAYIQQDTNIKTCRQYCTSHNLACRAYYDDTRDNAMVVRTNVVVSTKHCP